LWGVAHNLVLCAIKMNSLKFILTKLLIVSVCIGCSTPKMTDTESIYYKSFNIFQLTGGDTIAAPKVGNKQNLEFVKVTYRNKLPITITYNSRDREVVLKLDSSFNNHDRVIYIYSTGNLLGGKAGKQREYSFRSIDNGYKLYINLSDTIIVKSYDNIDIKRGDRYHYMVDVYTKKDNHFNRYSLLQADTKTSVSDDSLYKSWNVELKDFKPDVISAVDSFPPK
jgi:hypothetical protein